CHDEHGRHVHCRAETTTATTEDAARVVRPFIDRHEDSGYDLDGKEVDESAREAAQALADAGLLATARTRPTREQIAKVLARHDGKPVTTTADAVLTLLEGGDRHVRCRAETTTEDAEEV